MFRLKTGVNLTGLRPEVLVALVAALEVYRARDADLVVTSALDGKHSHGSLHYAGLALDLRTRHLETGQAREIAGRLRAVLGAQFDVLLEADHIHVEFQPKERP